MVHGLSRHATQRMVKSICDWIPPSGTRHHPRFAMVHTPVLIVVLFSCISLCLSLRLRMSETRPSWTLLPSSVSLPNAMYSNRPGTWAHDTMSRRVHEDILPRIIDDNADLLGQPDDPLFAETFMQLQDLKSSLECGTTGFLRPICDAGPDAELWNSILESVPEIQRNWLDAPWVITEFYFYRRIIEAFKYFDSKYDPFVKDKVRGLIEALPSIEDISSKLATLIDPAITPVNVALEIGLQTSLWGNKMDLSLWPAAKEANAEASSSSSSGSADVAEAGKISYGAALEAGRPFILDDHISEAVHQLMGARLGGRVDIIVDNAGYELVSDMLLGYILLKTGVASEVVFHTKGHPTFVSDATNADCTSTIQFLSTADTENARTLGSELSSFVAEGKFKFVEDLFWCQPTAFWDMPPHIQQRLAGSNLCIVKGDANYRRLLGEREWPMDTSAKDILSYWPVPVCALRTFKAEIGCGVSPQNQDRAQKDDPRWQVSGRFGVVQVGSVDA